MKISHAVGDGKVINLLIPELLRAAAEGRPARSTLVAPVRMPVARALLHHFGRHPERLAAALRVLRPPSTPARRPDVALAARPGVHVVPLRAGTRGHPDLARPPHARRVRGCRAVRSRAGRVRRDRPQPSWPGAVVLVDVRRYLPPDSVVNGNFSWGQYLVPTDLTDPRAMHKALAEQLSTGRPLATLALRTAKLTLGLGDGQPEPPRMIRANPYPELTLTNVGRLDGYLDLPWAAEPAERHNISVPTTSGPEGITVSFSELAGVLYVNASFHRSTFDPGAACDRRGRPDQPGPDRPDLAERRLTTTSGRPEGLPLSSYVGSALAPGPGLSLGLRVSTSPWAFCLGWTRTATGTAGYGERGPQYGGGLSARPRRP